MITEGCPVSVIPFRITAHILFDITYNLFSAYECVMAQ